MLFKDQSLVSHHFDQTTSCCRIFSRKDEGQTASSSSLSKTSRPVCWLVQDRFGWSTHENSSRRWSNQQWWSQWNRQSEHLVPKKAKDHHASRSTPPRDVLNGASNPPCRSCCAGPSPVLAMLPGGTKKSPC